MFQILEIAEIEVGKKTNHCLNFSSGFPIILIPINILVVNLKNAGRKQKFGYAKKCAIWTGNFTLSPVTYIRVEFKKLVSDLFHAGSALVERSSIIHQTHQNQ